MQIETLKVFCDLVESRSFSQAAVRNFVTQSAVSQQIKSLESHFDAVLLLRESRAITPTEAGRIFHQAAREILDRFELMQTELKAAGPEMAGTLRVATIYSVGIYEMALVMKSFLKAYPKVNLNLEYCQATRVYEDCLKGAVDLGIVPYPEPRQGIRIISLPADKLVLICAPDHPFARRRQIDLKKLDGQNFVAFEKSIASRRALDQIFRDNGIRVNIVVEFNNIETIKRSVEIGAGLSIVPLMSIQRELQSGALAQVQFMRERFVRPLGIIVRSHHKLTPAAKKLIELMQNP